jgi:hypothetical protein
MIPAFERFIVVVDRDGEAERAAERERSKLEPVAITFADQQDLVRLRELARLANVSEATYLRRRLRRVLRDDVLASLDGGVREHTPPLSRQWEK